MKYFGELEICHLTPDTLDATDNQKAFEVFNFYGSWIPGVSSGGCGNDGHSKIKFHSGLWAAIFLRLG